jgi:hypothetical protein
MARKRDLSSDGLPCVYLAATLRFDALHSLERFPFVAFAVMCIMNQ